MNIRMLTKLKIGAEIGAAVITAGFAVVRGVTELKGTKLGSKAPELTLPTEGLDDDLVAETISTPVVETVAETISETISSEVTEI